MKLPHILLAVIGATLWAGCAQPVKPLPAEKLIVSYTLKQDAEARKPLTSPCGCFDAIAEETPDGANLIVVKKHTGQRLPVMSTARNLGLRWITPPGNNQLVINNYRVSNQTTVHVYDPVKAKLIDVDRDAWQDFDPGDPGHRKFGNAHATAIGQSPDGTKLVLELHGWGDGEAWQYYLVNIADGTIVDKGRQYMPSCCKASPAVIKDKDAAPTSNIMYNGPKCCGDR